MTQPKSASVSFQGSLTPICIVVYLAIQALWKQGVPGEHSFTILRILFLIGIAILLWTRGRPAEIKDYFIGRFLPLGGPRALIFLPMLVLLTRLSFQLVFHVSPVTSSLFWSDTLEAPINEEIVFRGVFLAILLQYMPGLPWLAIGVSVLVFLTTHNFVGNGFLLSSILILGSLLGWTYWKTRSVPFCILCHALWNVLGDIPLLPSR